MLLVSVSVVVSSISVGVGSNVAVVSRVMVFGIPVH
jgi:hypothetical protein